MEPRQHDRTHPVIRAAKRADARQMGQVYVDAWRETYPSLLPISSLLAMSAERWARQFTYTIARGREIVLVADDRRDGVVGLATGGPVFDRGLSVGGARVSGEVYTLYVSPNAIGCGAGRGLLRALLTRLSDRGHKTAVAWMVKGNPARYFYEHTGARLIAEKREHRFGDSILLQAYAWSDLANGRQVGRTEKGH